jgi:hypothetical protein
VRRTLDFHAHVAFTSKQGQNKTIGQWGVRMDSVRGELQRAARKHMEVLKWTNDKRGGGDMLDLYEHVSFRVCMTGLKQWLKPKDVSIPLRHN